MSKTDTDCVVDKLNHPFAGEIRMNLFSGLFGKIEPGLCRLSMNGEIAVRTKNGYKAYSTKTGRLTNCDPMGMRISALAWAGNPPATAIV